METASSQRITFGDFELDLAASELRRNGRPVRLQPQPFKLLVLLVTRAGTIVTRDEIRHELWREDTFVDFDQGVNFSIRQIREGLRDDADRPVYVQTVPRRGYRFIAPVDRPKPPSVRPTGANTKLQQALWTNIVELRLEDLRRKRIRQTAFIVAVVLVVLVGVFLLLRTLR